MFYEPKIMKKNILPVLTQNLGPETNDEFWLVPVSELKMEHSS